MKRSRVNTHKKNIINNIFAKTGLPNIYISEIVDNIILILTKNIIQHKKLKIKNFGTFFFKKKNKRFGRNPKNETIHEISERNVVTFKLADNLKIKVNDYVKK
jgi:nucleoid DNA-binding protein